jgi:hypothetical protein
MVLTCPCSVIILWSLAITLTCNIYLLYGSLAIELLFKVRLQVFQPHFLCLCHIFVTATFLWLATF